VTLTSFYPFHRLAAPEFRQGLDSNAARYHCNRIARRALASIIRNTQDQHRQAQHNHAADRAPSDWVLYRTHRPFGVTPSHSRWAILFHPAAKVGHYLFRLRDVVADIRPGRPKDSLYEPALADSEREAVADLLQYLENVGSLLDERSLVTDPSVARRDRLLFRRASSGAEHTRLLRQCRSTKKRQPDIRRDHRERSDQLIECRLWLIYGRCTRGRSRYPRTHLFPSSELRYRGTKSCQCGSGQPGCQQ
jgi:hypothetical protein